MPSNFRFASEPYVVLSATRKYTEPFCSYASPYFESRNITVHCNVVWKHAYMQLSVCVCVCVCVSVCTTVLHGGTALQSELVKLSA
jgi:hypothetical protein